MIYVFKKRNKIALIIITLIVMVSMSIGYAVFSEDLTISGDVTISARKHQGVVVTNVELLSGSNLISSNPTVEDGNVNFEMEFGGSESEFNAVYKVTIYNDSEEECVYSNMTFSPTISGTNGASATLSATIDGLSNSDTIAAGETIEITITFVLEVSDASANYSVIADSEIATTTDTSGEIVATITPSSGDLSGSNELASFNLSVISTYSYNKNFTIKSSNSNFLVVDSNGNNYSGQVINANDEGNYTFYLKCDENAIFNETSQSTTITIISGSDVFNVSTLTLTVDLYVAPDTEAPTVGNVTVAMDTSTDGQAIISWDRIDTGGSNITNYNVSIYNSSDTLTKTLNTNSDVTNITATGLSEGSYYAVVYGTDESGNSGSSSCSSATTSNGYCSKSSTVALKWYFTITFSLTNASHSSDNPSNDKVFYNGKFTSTISGSGNYSTPNSVTITNSSGDSYSDYSYSSGSLTINNIKEDLTVTASGYCLVAGSKILLANGTYKNIEDITYNDLLVVINHNTGSITYEYPVFVEKEGKTSNYQKITFSDGSELNTVGYHGLFSYDKLNYVSVIDYENFNVGTKVAKLDKNNNIYYVTVDKIETIYEDVSYYQIVSNRYMNIIANDFITTDGTLTENSSVKFDNNLKWDTTNNDINDSFNWYDYSNKKLNYLINVYNSFDNNIKNIFYNGNMDIKSYANLLLELVKEPLKEDNKYLFKMTTSDNINSDNLYKEGSTYILPYPKDRINFKGWLNTSNDKIYYPLDKINVVSSTHFIALY